MVTKFVAVAVAVVLVSTAGVVAYAAVDFGRTFSEDATVLQGQDIDPPDIGELDDGGRGINILLAGLDACEEEYKQYFGGRCPEDAYYDPDSRAGVLNDVNLMVHISPEPRKVTVVSFPRDLMTSGPECTDDEGNVAYAVSRAALNEGYARGGINCIAQTITQLTGQTVDYAATVTWGGVIEITNAIGGVDVCVGGKGIHDRHTGLDLDPGNYTLAGVDALQFLRTRHGVSDGSDLGRIGNQQVYMSALARKLVSNEVLTNPGTLLTLARTTLQNVDPTSGLTDPVTLVQLAMATKNVPLSEWVFVQYPVVDDPYDSNKVAPNEMAAAQIWAALEANVPIDLTGGTGGGALEEGADDEGGDQGEVVPDEQVTETPGTVAH